MEKKRRTGRHSSYSRVSASRINLSEMVSVSFPRTSFLAPEYVCNISS